MKRVVAIRLSPELFEEVQSLSPNVSQAVERALLAWVRSERRKAAKAAPLAKHLAPPTERELKAQAGSHPMPLPPDAPQLGGKKLGAPLPRRDRGR